MSKIKSKIRTIFIGTPDFAVPSLHALINDEQFNIISIVTQPDKKAGRKQVITPPPIKVEAKKYGIPILQPGKILNFKSEILNLKPELIVVVAYAQIIPENILNIPKYGVINIHGSLLPKYRGASCIQHSIMNGDVKTGVTIMKMDKGLDTGSVLSQSEINILKTDTAGSLYKKLSKLGAEIIAPTLKKYISGEIKLEPQDNSQTSYVGLLKKQDGKIDWKKSAIEIGRFVRAMNPWPSAFASLNIKNKKINIKIIEAEYEPLKINEHKTGELFLHNNKLAIQCGKDALIINKLQLEGKKEMTTEEFINGYSVLVGSVLR